MFCYLLQFLRTVRTDLFCETFFICLDVESEKRHKANINKKSKYQNKNQTSMFSNAFVTLYFFNVSLTHFSPVSHFYTP